MSVNTAGCFNREEFAELMLLVSNHLPCYLSFTFELPEKVVYLRQNEECCKVFGNVKYVFFDHDDHVIQNCD